MGFLVVYPESYRRAGPLYPELRRARNQSLFYPLPFVIRRRTSIFSRLACARLQQKMTFEYHHGLWPFHRVVAMPRDISRHMFLGQRYFDR